MKLKNKCLAPYSSKWLVPVSQEIIQFICWNQELGPPGAVPAQWWDVWLSVTLVASLALAARLLSGLAKHSSQNPRAFLLSPAYDSCHLRKAIH